jgi:tetratricopeptide (TPR) repeat protein
VQCGLIELICPFCEFKIGDDNYIGITRCPDCSRAFSVYYAIGKEQLSKKKYEEAIESFFKAIKFFKNTALLHLDLARAYFHIGNDEGYTFALNRAEEIDEELYHEYVQKYNLKKLVV